MADGVAVRTVSEVMSTDPVTAVPSETIAEAAGRMADRRVGSVVVVDGDRIGVQAMLGELPRKKIAPRDV